jgi:hypothetical protein
VSTEQQVVYLYHRRFARGEEFAIFEDPADADALAAAGKEGELTEVIGCAVIPAGSRFRARARRRSLVSKRRAL